MSEEMEHQVPEGEQVGSHTYPKQCSALRKGEYVMLKGKPCKIVDMSTSKTGKHGHAKVHITGIDIFEEKKVEDISPSTHNMDVPNVYRKDLQVAYVERGGDDWGTVHVFNQDGSTSEVRCANKRWPEVVDADEIIQKDDSKMMMVATIEALGRIEIDKVTVKDDPNK